MRCARPPRPLHVVPAEATIAVGVTQYVFASSRRADWSSSDPTVAAVDPLVTGAIKGIAPGTATITATHGTKTATMTITVV